MATPFTRIIEADDSGIAEASELICAGQPVAVPTETVYGLAADATNAAAVARVYDAKGRPAFNPLIVHVSDYSTATMLGDLNDEARNLAAQYWPGPLTLVVPAKAGSGIASLVTAGLGTIGLRVPAHPAIRALLKATRRPLAAPSANSSGSISPTRAEHVLKSLGGRIPLILDGGPSQRGIESTIVAATGGGLRLLRRGPLEIDGLAASGGGQIEAPGMLASHYAPSKPLRLDVSEPNADEFLIGYGERRGECWLGAELVAAAAKLFDCLHHAEASDKPRIAVAPIPDHGLGAAINDRLARAATPR